MSSFDSCVDLVVGDGGNGIAISAPLLEIFAQYKATRSELESIAKFAGNAGGGMSYFFEAAQRDGRTYIPRGLFDLGPAVKALDATYWQKVMLLTGVLEIMSADKRSKWNIDIYEHNTVPFEEECVRNTVYDLMSRRDLFLAERVDGLFRELSGAHVTNRPEGFSARMIIANVLDGDGDVAYKKAAHIHDLRCVIAKLQGRDFTEEHITRRALDGVVRGKRFGEWCEFDGGAFSLKLFKKGTAHMEFSEDVAIELNAILARLYPAAIPEKNRMRKTAKPRSKVYALHGELLSGVVVGELLRATVSHGGCRLFFGDICNKLNADAIRVLRILGGVEVRSSWFFEYDVRGAIDEIARTSKIPEFKSHQFYHTQAALAARVAEWADLDGMSSENEILEPSAGVGGLVAGIPESLRKRVVAVEVNRLFSLALGGWGLKSVVNEDFLAWEPGKRFSRILMNPPFSEGRAEAHLRHAAGMLAVGGVLVAVLPARSWSNLELSGCDVEVSDTIQDAFEMTGVSVVLLKVRRRRF